MCVAVYTHEFIRLVRIDLVRFFVENTAPTNSEMQQMGEPESFVVINTAVDLQLHAFKSIICHEHVLGEIP